MTEKSKNIMSEKNFVTLTIGETNYQTLLTSKFKNRKPYTPPDPKKIYSYIPGTVVKILAKPGEKLEAGDAIVILDAMKMMNRVTLPDGGVIKIIHVREGETIPRKHLIAELR
jgi:biotin carboxyl carrier protein